jgi:hypothetical protein
LRPPKTHLLALTKPELKSLLLACEGELFYHELHDEKTEARRYTGLCELLQRKLDGIAAEERFRARERRRRTSMNLGKPWGEELLTQVRAKKA